MENHTRNIVTHNSQVECSAETHKLLSYIQNLGMVIPPSFHGLSLDLPEVRRDLINLIWNSHSWDHGCMSFSNRVIRFERIFGNGKRKIIHSGREWFFTHYKLFESFTLSEVVSIITKLTNTIYPLDLSRHKEYFIILIQLVIKGRLKDHLSENDIASILFYCKVRHSDDPYGRLVRLFGEVFANIDSYPMYGESVLHESIGISDEEKENIKNLLGILTIPELKKICYTLYPVGLGLPTYGSSLSPNGIKRDILNTIVSSSEDMDTPAFLRKILDNTEDLSIDKIIKKLFPNPDLKLYNSDDEIGLIIANLGSIKKRSKTPISRQLKEELWKRYIGDSINAPCLCCNKNTISILSFHTGHITSESDGGETSIDNLLPICSACNSSMGSENLIQYSRRTFGNHM